MREEIKFLRLCKRLKIHVKKFDEQQFIREDAWKLGARVAYTFMDIDFNFSPRGKLIGINSERAGSFFSTKAIRL